MKVIRFFTFGCKVNQYDTQSIQERFLAKGFRLSKGKNGADYFLINTCTVTSVADQKSRNAIRRCIRSNPRAKVIVTGCMVEKDATSLYAIKGISLIVKKSFFPEGITGFSSHTRAFLKIQDGCSNFCTYCKVALVRGKERSRQFEEVIEEAEKLVSSGYKEIVLTGICLGAYGKDLNLPNGLVDVIERLERIKGLSRIRLSSIEAADISQPLIKQFKTSKKLCRHLHIPIQSGDDKILKLMNRKYTSRKYARLISRLKKNIPGISITTDCLVGFPQETVKNFENTIKLLKKIEPLKTHIFPYSVRSGTKASGFDGAVDSKAIRIRCRQAEEASKICRYNFMRRYLSRELSVLIEGRSKEDSRYLEGLTDNYLQVRVPFKAGLKNRIISVKPKGILGDFIVGECVDNFRNTCKIRL